MTATATATSPAAPPRWARIAATLTVLSTVPSGLWRVAMAVGVPVGVDGNYRSEHYGFPGWGTAYVFGLTFLLLALALLTFGLVRPWGERVPQWVPFVGGKHVPRLAAIIPALAGALALTLLWATAFLNLDGIFVEYGLDGVERIVVLVCYAPLLLWGPLLAAVTASYAKRTRIACGAPGSS
ncbi:MAG: hypothetical protein H0X58_05605 [Acidimicrobiia bacterium]|nr:hypothetical protein [Acidimicrobiia bacterium]